MLESRASRWTAGVVLAVGAPFALALALTLNFGSGDRIAGGVSVSGVRIGAMSRAEAESKLRDWARGQSRRQVTLTALDRRWTGAYSDVGLRVDWEASINDAFSIGRTGSIFVRMVCALTSYGPGKRLEARTLIDEDQVGRAIDKAAAYVNRPHSDARLRIVGGRLEIVQDKWGIVLDEGKARKVLADALAQGRSVVSLPIRADKPDVTAADVRGINTLLGRFATFFRASQRDRTHNLAKAASAIDGVIVRPGEVLSYNKTVGPRDAKTGFRNAPIFVKGKLEPGIGGGICQVSTTLYNAVLLAGLKIVERSPHCQVVPYVSPGRDATVAYGLRDFRFENNTSNPVAVLTQVSGGRLTVDVYGSSEDKKRVSVFSGKVTRTAAGYEMIVDPSLKPGRRRVVEKGNRGARVTVYRKIVSPDGSEVTETLSRDNYRAQKKITAVAPSEAPATASRVEAAPASTTRAPVADVMIE